jgi:hypothetical protein
VRHGPHRKQKKLGTHIHRRRQQGDLIRFVKIITGGYRDTEGYTDNKKGELISFKSLKLRRDTQTDIWTQMDSQTDN